jgi:hypothetical protein
MAAAVPVLWFALAWGCVMSGAYLQRFYFSKERNDV